VVGVGELEAELTSLRVYAALVLAAEVEAKRRLAVEPGELVGRQGSAATARARRQQHSEDARRGEHDGSPE
jgi:hypothetical protein